MGLTTKEIENAKPGNEPHKLADGGGLCLLISPTGARLWRWRYRFNGTEKMMALGEYLQHTAASATDARQRPGAACFAAGPHRAADAGSGGPGHVEHEKKTFFS
jgi:hypothetical protein